MTYIVYGFSACPYCVKAKQFLEDVEEEFEYVSIDDPEERRRWLDEWNILPPNRTWPKIYRRDEGGLTFCVGGYRELLDEFTAA